MANNKFNQELKTRALSLGFDVCRVTDASLPEKTALRLEDAISQNHHGTMEWMETTLARRKSAKAMWPDANTAVLLGMNYGPETDPLEDLLMRENANISVYARHRDYHDVIKGKLKTLAGWLAAHLNAEVKVFVDTAPLMEKPLAQQAGIGWQGKHTNLVSREFGSWLFLGSILTSATLEPDTEETDHCGSCGACLDICPTDAFPAPYKLDARKCISYLTIEHKGPIPHQFREAIGNRIYGCDDCLAVCPWNKYAQNARETKLVAREDLKTPSLTDLSKLDDEKFRKKFSGSPVKRIGRDRFMRNVLIAIGNSQNPELAQNTHSHLRDPNPLVRGAAVWATGKLEDHETFANMKQSALETEQDDTVRAEWNLF